MLDKNFILDRLHSMSEKDLSAMIRMALDASNVPYVVGKGKLQYSGLYSDSARNFGPFYLTLEKSATSPVFDRYTGYVEPPMQSADTDKVCGGQTDHFLFNLSIVAA